MGLLDFVLHKGTLFTNNEIELLDKHFIDILETEGIKFLFGNPGTTELAIMEA